MKKILAVPLVCAGLSMSSVTLGSPILSGYDLFRTDSQGTFTDLSLLGGPSQVFLKGYPDLLSEGGLYETIVHRKEGITDFLGSIDIELVALSLKTEAPVYLGIFKKDVDVYVLINTLGLPNFPKLTPHLEINLDTEETAIVKTPLPPSTGKMTIRHENSDNDSSQGTFDSELSAHPYLIFVEAGGDLDNPEDWLIDYPVADPRAPIKMVSPSGEWSHTAPHTNTTPPNAVAPPPNNEFSAGRFYVQRIGGFATKEGLHKHFLVDWVVPSNGCGPGPHWVDKCPAGTDGAPSTAVVTIEIPCGGASQKVILRGPTKIERQAGVPHIIDTEIVSMVLTGGGGGGITLRAGVNEGVSTPTLGKIEELANPALAKAFFDVYFEIDTPLGTLHNRIPHHMEAIIDRVPPIRVWHFPIDGAPPITPLYKDINDKDPAACLVNSRHRLDRPDGPFEVPIKTVYCVHDGLLNDSQFCYGTPTPFVNPLGPVYENCDIESLDIMHSTDDLYAAAGDNTPRKSHLYYVYKHNGDVVDLGDIGGPGFLEEIDALSFHPLTDDLWGWAQGNGLFKITVVPLPPLFPQPPFFPPSPFTAEPLFPEAIPIQPVVNINNSVCKKPTSKVPTIPAELVLEMKGEIEDITWNQSGDRLYGVKNLHTDHPVDSHGKEEGGWPYIPLHPDIDYEEGIELWVYHYNTGKYEVVCPNLAPTIAKILGNEAEIEGLESLPNNFINPNVPAGQDLIVVSFHGPNIIYYAGIITSPTGSSQQQCNIWISPDKTAFNDIEGMAASPFLKPSSPPPGYPHFW